MKRLVALGLAVFLTLTGCGILDGDSNEPQPSTSQRVESPATTRTPEHTQTERPNFLVIEADDMRADELRWMPKTLALLGDKGLNFRNSFAPNPLCCPARASFLTGKYSHNHHVLSHEEPYGFGAFDDSTTLATQLQAAGYQTGLVGKYLNGYGVQPVHGTSRESLKYVPPGWDQWWGASDHIWPEGSPIGGNTYAYFHLTSNVNGQIKTWPGEYNTNVMGRQVRQVLDGFEQRDKAPWFVWWTPIAPHHGVPFEPDDPGVVERTDGYPVRWDTPARPQSVKGSFDDQITSGLGVPPTGSPEADRKDKPKYLRNLPDLSEEERDVLLNVSRQRAEAISVLDDEVATTIRSLATSNEAERTIVMFTSDNGYYLGEHAKRQGKINLHEPSIRVPLLMAGPGIPRGERFDPITPLDLATTIAGLAGADLPDADGEDVWPVVTKGDSGWTRPIVLEGLMGEKAYAEAAGRARWGRSLNTVGLRLGHWKTRTLCHRRDRAL
ncbi:MAG: sulfatase-like hydrolase/transferase [Nocardioides sp.]